MANVLDFATPVGTQKRVVKDLPFADPVEQPEPKEAPVSILKAVFPGTEQALRADIPAPSPNNFMVPGYPQHEEPLSRSLTPLALVGDVASLEQRVFGKLAGVSNVSDIEGGYLKSARLAARKTIDSEIEKVKKSDLPDFLKKASIIGLKSEDFLKDAILNAVESPISTALTLGTGPVAKAAGEAAPIMRRGVLRFGSLEHAEPAVARAATKEGRQELSHAAATETPDLMAREVRGAVEGVQEGTQKELDNAITGVAPARKEPFDRGESLYDALQKGRQAAGQKFEQGTQEALEKTGVSGAKIPWKITKGQTENAAQTEAADLLKQIEYDPSKGEFGKIGNRAIGEKGIGFLKKWYDQLKAARTTDDVLTMRRLIDNEINFGGEKNASMFAKGSDDEFVAKALRDRLNNVIEAQFTRKIKDPEAAKAAAEAWRAKNAFYSDVSGALGDVAGAMKDKTQSYITALEGMDYKKLKSVMQAAQENPKELGQVADEIRGGIVDAFVNRSLKDGRIDYKAAKTAWEKIDPELRRVMFSTKQREQIDFALKKFAEQSDAGIAGKELGHYLSSDEKTLSDKLGNVAQDDKRYVLKELEFLDALQGRSGKESFAYRAKAMSQARQLGMNSKGQLPMISGERSGKFLAGSGAGAAAGATIGGAIGGPVGSALGAVGGLTAGSVAQSPWGIVNIYRALTKLEEASKAAAPVGRATAKASATKAAVSATRKDRGANHAEND